MNLNQSGRATVLVGTQLREHYESLPERGWFSKIHYLALVCASDELAARLQARPEWRGFSSVRIAEHVAFNDWLRANAASTSPPMSLVDTTGITATDTVAAIGEWVRARLGSA